VACLASWALGPVIGLGVVVHQLDHHEVDALALSGMAQVAVHGHFHEKDANDHSHEAPPPSLTTSPLSSQNRLVVVAAANSGGQPPRVELIRQSDPLSIPTSHGPPSPFSLCVLRL